MAKSRADLFMDRVDRRLGIICKGIYDVMRVLVAPYVIVGCVVVEWLEKREQKKDEKMERRVRMWYDNLMKEEEWRQKEEIIRNIGEPKEEEETKE